MRQQKFLLFLFAIPLFIAGYSVLAQEGDDITFPVAELGNCENETECRAYCDDSSHLSECVDFAQEHGFMTAEEAARARAFAQAGSGPGGCSSEQSCESYCDDTSHLEECLSFAEAHNLMSSEELQEAKKVAQALRSGAQLPGNCTSKESCDAYCGDTSHMRECITFAEQAGLIPEEELAEAKQVLKALEAGVRPPGNCNRKEECEAYCQDPSHTEECFNFAVAAGFIPPEEVEQARKAMSLMASGGMPGNCRSKEECEAYCADESNIQECADKFTQAGFMTEEEKEMFLKTGGKGPGDCKGREECESFCNDPANQETCFAFAKEHGLISQEELANIEEGMQRMKEGIESAPPEVQACLQEKVGAEVLDKIRSGQFTPNPQIGDSMRECFEMQMQMMENQMRECLAMPCSEAFACLESSSPQAGPGPEGEEGGPGGPGGEGGLENEIQAKIESCMQEMQTQGQEGGAPPGFEGGPPPGFEGGMPPEFQGGPRPEGFQMPEGFQGSPEEFRQQMEQQMQQQIQQQYEQQFQQQYQEQLQQQFQPPSGEFAPPPAQQTAPPPGGSVLDAFLYLLIGLLP